MPNLDEARGAPTQDPVKTDVQTTGSPPVIDERGAWLFAVAWEVHHRRHGADTASPLSRTSLFCALLLLEEDIRRAAESAGLRTRNFFSVIGFADEPLPGRLPTPPPDLQLTDHLADILTSYRSRSPKGTALDRLALAHLLLSDPDGLFPNRVRQAGGRREEIQAVLEWSMRQGLLHRLVAILRFRRDQLAHAAGGDDAHEGPSPFGRFLALASKVTATDQPNRQGLVEALAAMLEDPDQETPLTIALLGDWGSGKSTLMALLRKRLLEVRSRRFCFADFNAWEYELTDNMAAGLAQEVLAGVSADTRLGGRLSRWISPAFWWLFGGFVILRHGWRLLALLAIAAAGLWLAREHESLLSFAGITVNRDVIEIAGVAGALVVLFYLFRGAKHILEHPFAIGLKTYLRFPQYERHLGLVPVIKREVETLARLWLGRTWAQRLAARWLARGDRRVRYAWLERWNRPRRLVVFVDDLDRCSHARIGQTLDAIRLVMDLPHVVVVLGIDPRIAFQAMAQQYKDLAEPRRSKEEIARDYLGKIIQVPIRLRRPSPEELDGFVSERLFAGATGAGGMGNAATAVLGTGGAAAAKGSLGVDEQFAGSEAPLTGDHGGGLAPGSPRVRSSTIIPPPFPGGGVADAYHVAGTWVDASEQALSNPLSSTPGGQPDVTAILLRPHLAEIMRPNDDERRSFQKLVRAFGFHNPRQLIRLFNSYSLLKLFAATRRVAGDPETPREEELMPMIFLEELLHETPAPIRFRLEKALTADASDRSTPSGYESRVNEVKLAVVTDKGREAWSLLEDKPLRDFVQLVVLPSSAQETASQPAPAAPPPS